MNATETAPSPVDAYGPRPTWRGKIHLGAFLVALPAGLWLLAGAHTTAARVAVAIYWASVAGLFATSMSYHLFARTERSVMWMRRLDHSMIFVMIAGSYTPLCLVVLPAAWGIPLLVVTWVTALAGIIMKMLTVTADGNASGSWLYIVAGWTSVIALPKLLTELGAVDLVLLAAGGLLFTTAGPGEYCPYCPSSQYTAVGYAALLGGFAMAASGGALLVLGYESEQVDDSGQEGALAVRLGPGAASLQWSF